MRYSEQYVTSHDGTRLFVRTYQQPNIEQTLVIVHGFGEHGGRYNYVANQLVERGWNVVIGDLRGHGRSEGVRTHVDRFDQFTNDVRVLTETFELDPTATAIVGHSAGGLITIRTLQTFSGIARAAVVTSPLLRMMVPVPRPKYLVGRVCSVVRPRTRFKTTVDQTHITRSMDILEQRMRDPLMERSITARGFFAAQRAIARAWRHASRIDVPMLILQAGADRVVDPAAPAEWITRLNRTEVQLEMLDDHFHEVLNEPDRDHILSLLSEWCESRVAQPIYAVA